MEYTMKILDRIKLHHIKTNKFTTNFISVRFNSNLERENVTTRSLLANIFGSATKKYPNKRVLITALEELYGAGFSCYTGKKGSAHTISFDMSIVDGDLIKDSQIFKQGIDFLSEVIFNPILDDKNNLEEEKRLLKSELKSVLDNKMRYSFKKLFENMFKGESYSVAARGYIEDIPNIKTDDIMSEYNKMIDTNFVDVYFVGNVSVDDVANVLKTNFKLPNDTKKIVNVNFIDKQKYTPKSDFEEVVEKQDLSQSNLCIGYRLDVFVDDEDYFASMVTNGILGGYTHSKLFMNVREKHSLCYTVFSTMENHKGFLAVYAGIAHEKYNQAVEIIQEQVKDMVEGNITDDEIEITKINLINSVNQLTDSPNGIMSHYFLSDILKKEYSVEEWSRRIAAVSKKDVMNVAKKLIPDTIYFLTGGNE